MATGGGIADTTAVGGANAVAEILSAGGGTATATASGIGAAANSFVDANCTIESIATGADSNAQGQCQNPGSVVTVEATKGSTAKGSDTVAPTCTPMNGGKAKVRSPAGNCG